MNPEEDKAKVLLQEELDQKTSHQAEKIKGEKEEKKTKNMFAPQTKKLLPDYKTPKLVSGFMCMGNNFLVSGVNL
jgi:hypothetical protein